MSVNKTVNAIIALIEGRPEVAREFLRSPELKANAGDVSSRLYWALEEAKAKTTREALRAVLRATMRLECPFSKREQVEAWTEGLISAEKVLELAVSALETEGKG